MLREIYEQPAALAATIDRYMDGEGFSTASSDPILEWLKRVQTKLLIAASGSSRHAGLFCRTDGRGLERHCSRCGVR